MANVGMVKAAIAKKARVFLMVCPFALRDVSRTDACASVEPPRFRGGTRATACALPWVSAPDVRHSGGPPVERSRAAGGRTDGACAAPSQRSKSVHSAVPRVAPAGGHG